MAKHLDENSIADHKACICEKSSNRYVVYVDAEGEKNLLSVLIDALEGEFSITEGLFWSKNDKSLSCSGQRLNLLKFNINFSRNEKKIKLEKYKRSAGKCLEINLTCEEAMSVINRLNESFSIKPSGEEQSVVVVPGVTVKRC